MWEFFIKNNKFAYLFLVALISVGSYSIFSIARESSPEVIVPIGVITTVLPGAPAADIESLVTNEIERGLNGLENVTEITSTSREGVSTVVVEFDASADIDESIGDLKDEIDTIKADLPSDAEDPFVSEVNFQDQPVMLIALSADRTSAEFNTLSLSLEEELESIAGVSRVEFRGVQDREVTVIVDQAEIFNFDITISDITTALRNANITFPIGQIENNGVSYNVAFEGDITDSSQIENVVITTRGEQPVFVRDVAEVVDGLAPASSISRLSIGNEPSQSSISLSVFKQSGGDITRITKAISTRILELQEPGEILDGIESVTVLDAGPYVMHIYG